MPSCIYFLYLQKYTSYVFVNYEQKFSIFFNFFVKFIHIKNQVCYTLHISMNAVRTYNIIKGGIS